MKNLKSKIRDFLNSEEGRVGVKTPLALGVTTGGLMLAQAIISTPVNADQVCIDNDNCGDNERCESVSHGFKILGLGPGQQATVVEVFENHCVPM